MPISLPLCVTYYSPSFGVRFEMVNASFENYNFQFSCDYPFVILNLSHDNGYYICRKGHSHSMLQGVIWGNLISIHDGLALASKSDLPYFNQPGSYVFEFTE